MMTTTKHTHRDLDAQRKERMMRELQSDLTAMVEAAPVLEQTAQHSPVNARY